MMFLPGGRASVSRNAPASARRASLDALEVDL